MKKLTLLLFTLTSTFTQASFPEFYGSAVSTSSIGNQPNTTIHDPANLYYAPAMSAWAKKLGASFSTSRVATSFTPIKNITKKNSTTGSSNTEGDVSVDYEDVNIWGLSLILPVAYKDFGALGISYFGPIGKFAQTDSGDPQLPEYVMYKARYTRTQIHMNYAYPWSPNLAFSLGFHMGFQAAAKVDTNISLSDDNGSYGGAKTEIKPTLGTILSTSYRLNRSMFSFTYQQEMKHNFDTQATGEIVDPSISIINIGIESMLYYDPHTFRASLSNQFDFLKLYTSLEYQLWDNYKAPVLKVNNLGGNVKSSDNYEVIRLKNILIPKIGLSTIVSDQLNINAGVHYRPTPFDSDFSGAGNSIDTDSLIYSAGLTYGFKMFSKSMNFGLSLQYHDLIEKEVVKTSGQENSTSGNKIGAPGYSIGGHVFVSSVGIKVYL